MPTLFLLDLPLVSARRRTLRRPPGTNSEDAALTTGSDISNDIYSLLVYGNPTKSPLKAPLGLWNFHQPVKELKSPGKIYIKCPYDFASKMRYTVNVSEFESVKKNVPAL